MDEKMEAMHYERLDKNVVKCLLCPHRCMIKEGNYGKCNVRKNEKGVLYSENYGKIAAIAMDPVEKKPLFHFYPGKYLLSIGTIGCNFSCDFCQNYQIAQEKAEVQEATSSYIVDLCKKDKDCIGIAYTYNEPSIWYEFVLQTSKLAHERGYKNVLVTNGFISEKPLMELLPYIDAMNIDVKAFHEEYYKSVCGGRLREVKKTVELAARHCHIEITTLIIPELNDSAVEIENLCKWIKEINPEIPLHITRYFPRYKMNKPPTPIETLYQLKAIAEKFLDYVYIGNV